MPTVMSPTAVRVECVLQPTLAQHAAWWHDLVRDPLVPEVFTDMMPTSLAAFLAPDHIKATVLLDDETTVLGAFWLHDYGFWAGHPYTWCGVYIRPQYRHSLSAALGRAMRRCCRHYGYRTIFVACRQANVAAQRFAERAFGLRPLGVYPRWAPFEGQLDDVMLFTARREDAALCWQVAEERHQIFRAWMSHDQGVSVMR